MSFIGCQLNSGADSLPLGSIPDGGIRPLPCVFLNLLPTHSDTYNVLKALSTVKSYLFFELAFAIENIGFGLLKPALFML